MPLNETDKAWIRQEIQAAHRRHGWGKLTGFIKDWSGAGAAAGILLFIATQWGGYIEFRTGTNLRLGNIEDSIKQIRRDLSPLQIGAVASLPSDSFQAALPQLKSALSIAKKEQVPVAPKIVSQLQSNFLSANQDSPDFWPTVSEFISYRSESAVPPLKANLPHCTDGEPSRSEVTAVRPNSVDFSARVYQDCVVTLDSTADMAKINWLILHDAPFLTFRHCLIVYRGGPLDLIVEVTNLPAMVQVGKKPPILTTFSGRTLHFDNCRFDFAFSSPPPRQGQHFVKQLLAQSPTSADVQVG
jgi:hypothetical protein